MTERQPTPRATWDIPSIAEALGTAPEPQTDVILGTGVAFRLGIPSPIALEVYEQARTIRVTGGEVQIALFNLDGPQFAPEGIVFEQPSAPRPTVFSIAPSGEVNLFLGRPTRTRQEVPDRPEQPIDLPSPAELLRNDSVTSQEAFSAQLPDDTETSEPEERVRLSGRLGTDPRFRETKNGVLIGSFPLGVTHENGSTTWEQVVTFRERAEWLRSGAGPKKGQTVEVIGYRHRRGQPNKEGKVRVIEEVYAVVVKAR